MFFHYGGGSRRTCPPSPAALTRCAQSPHSFKSRCSAERSEGVIGQISLQATHMQLTGRPLLSESSNSIRRNVTTLESLHLGHLDETCVLSITQAQHALTFVERMLRGFRAR